MKEMFRRRRLPHWDFPGATYFITACLDGSIPAEGLLDIARFRNELAARPRPENMSDNHWNIRRSKLTFARTDEWLDRRAAVRHLADKVVAAIVADGLYYFAGQRYEMLAYVIMPSHIHWVFTPMRAWEGTLPVGKSAREKIMHSVKRETGYRCNQQLGLAGAFWQRESYDHCVEDQDELERIIDYVELNPVKAGLAKSREQWPFSSAYDRQRWNLPVGRALARPD